MGESSSGFRSPQDAERYFDIYDRLVETNWPVPHEELDIPSAFGTTRMRVSGTGYGVPLVLLHATTGSSAGWSPLISALCTDRRVYTPDTIGGAGRSVQTEPIARGADLVRWLDELFDRLELDRVHVAGYSEGGWIAGFHAALTGQPERLVSLTLVEPAGAIERVPARFIAGMVLRGVRVLLARDKRAAVDRLNRWMNGDVELSDAQVEMLEAAMGSFRQKLPVPKRLDDDQLRRITVPTLLLLGADTKLYDPERARDRAVALLPRVDAEIIPNAGHGLAFQHPDLVTGKICDHVRTAESPS
jgi:pimeloyl-ACP methyl ester carboxylesterase